MIIRSQDKKSIINFDNIEAVKLNEIQISISNDRWYFEIRYYNFKEDGELLGIYSTYEKAIKVMDMIQKRYCEFCCNEFCSVFEMPQDSEV